MCVYVRVPRCAVWLAANQRSFALPPGSQQEQQEEGNCRDCRKKGAVPVYLCLSQRDCGGGKWVTQLKHLTSTNNHLVKKILYVSAYACILGCIQYGRCR